MRNTSHLKKFIQPGPCTETRARKKRNEIPTTEQSEAAELNSSTHVDKHPPQPSESNPTTPSSRPVRAKQLPAGMKDFVFVPSLRNICRMCSFLRLICSQFKDFEH